MFGPRCSRPENDDCRLDDDARRKFGEALAAGGLDQIGRHVHPRGAAPSLRYVLCSMIEEYNRHSGDADLLRESVDGKTGE
jgi:hypothetical protein